MLGDAVTETGRLETFADGVFAIAITLLVLGIRAPAPNVNLGTALADEWPEFVAYVVSFLTIGIMWAQHHRRFTIIRRSNTTFAMINVVFLMFVALCGLLGVSDQRAVDRGLTVLASQPVLTNRAESAGAGEQSRLRAGCDPAAPRPAG